MCLVNSFKVFKDVTDTDEEKEGEEKDAVSNGRTPGPIVPRRRTTSKQFGITRNERGARRENEKEKQFNGRNKNKMITGMESER